MDVSPKMARNLCWRDLTPRSRPLVGACVGTGRAPSQGWSESGPPDAQVPGRNPCRPLAYVTHRVAVTSCPSTRPIRLALRNHPSPLHAVRRPEMTLPTPYVSSVSPYVDGNPRVPRQGRTLRRRTEGLQPGSSSRGALRGGHARAPLSYREGGYEITLPDHERNSRPSPSPRVAGGTCDRRCWNRWWTRRPRSAAGVPPKRTPAPQSRRRGSSSLPAGTDEDPHRLSNATLPAAVDKHWTLVAHLNSWDTLPDAG